MVRWVALVVLLAVVVLEANAGKAKRQVTYHADGHLEPEEDEDSQSHLPATKKPLPHRVIYPGDLSSFYTTELSTHSRTNNITSKAPVVSQRGSRRRRSNYIRRREGEGRKNMRNPSTKFSRNRDIHSMESRLHSSYHKPSVSIMNDVPVEMSFDGAGFLRHEDEEFEEEKNTQYSRGRDSAPRSAKATQNKNRALDDFRKAFNISRERVPSQVKFDDESSFQSETPPFQASEGTAPDYGTQGAENGTPLAVDYMAAYQNAFQNSYQNGMFGNPQFNYAPTQPTLSPQTQAFDPYNFNFPNMFGGQSNMNQMMPQTMQQDSFMQNHRIPQMPNPGAISPPQTMYSQVPQQQTFPTNPMYTQPSPSPQQTHKTQRRKRSIPALRNVGGDTIPSESHLTQDHYSYARQEDQQDSSSAFIPFAGNFNGGSIQLNIPFYGQSPIIQPNYSPGPQFHSPYSAPGRSEARHFGGSEERFYHPSEARRYSYGVLGSGNFEVIRGGLFPGERQQSYRGNGYQDGRNTYGGDDWNGNNYGTTEIIIDGPIQGFQGFDNFQLINALSKHSEIAVRPDRRDSEEDSK